MSTAACLDPRAPRAGATPADPRREASRPARPYDERELGTVRGRTTDAPRARSTDAWSRLAIRAQWGAVPAGAAWIDAGAARVAPDRAPEPGDGASLASWAASRRGAERSGIVSDARAAASAALAAVAPLIARAWRAWRRERRIASGLRELDDRMLRDLGLRRADLEHAARGLVRRAPAD